MTLRPPRCASRRTGLSRSLASRTMHTRSAGPPRGAGGCSGGKIFSQDEHLPLVIDVFRDDVFWHEELDSPRRVDGLGEFKLIMLTKPGR